MYKLKKNLNLSFFDTHKFPLNIAFVKEKKKHNFTKVTLKTVGGKNKKKLKKK